MKKVRAVLDGITKVDIFASEIKIRYDRDDDYKTTTGAFISLAVLIFLSTVFIRSFVSMVNRTDITTSTTQEEEQDPSFYNLSMSRFMFALTLTGIDLTSGLRYFNIKSQLTSIVNGTKTKVLMDLVTCEQAYWTRLDPSFASVFDRLTLNNSLCPNPNNTNIELQGKYTSDVFRYVKIVFSACTGTVNGRGCRNSSQITSFLAKNQVFSMSFYFTNILLNPDTSTPSTYYFQDTNNFPFSIKSGTSCNFFLQSYEMNTDTSVMPYQSWVKEQGGLASQTAMMTTYRATKGEYMRFYIRKGPIKIVVTREYYGLDDLLAYVGGLFGLLVMAVQIPIFYYNVCCYQLSLANKIFQYPPDLPPHDSQHDTSSMQSEPNNDRDGETTASPQKKVIRENFSPIKTIRSEDAFAVGSFGTIDYTSEKIIPLQNQSQLPKENKDNRIKDSETSQQEKQKDLHDLQRFNFFWFLLYFPFFAFKRFGWKSLENRILTPYYKAIQEIRKQIDMVNLIKRFFFVQRFIKSAIDIDQRMLLHVHQKEDINELARRRRGYKYIQNVMEEAQPEEAPGCLQNLCKKRSVADSSGEQQAPQVSEKARKIAERKEYAVELLRVAYQKIARKRDPTSYRILTRIDPKLIEMISSQMHAYARGVDNLDNNLNVLNNSSIQEEERQDSSYSDHTVVLPMVEPSSETKLNSGELPSEQISMSFANLHSTDAIAFYASEQVGQN